MRRHAAAAPEPAPPVPWQQRWFPRLRVLEWVYACLILLACVGFAGHAVYWRFFDEINVLEQEVGSVAVVDGGGEQRKDFAPGETMWVRRDYCINVAMSGHVSRLFLNHHVYLMPTVTIQFEPGCYQRAFGLLVPDLPPGRYTFRESIEYDLNPLKVVTEQFEDVPITIRSRGAKPGSGAGAKKTPAATFEPKRPAKKPLWFQFWRWQTP